MPHSHDLSSFITGDDLEALRQRIRCSDQRMIARYHGLFCQTLEQRLFGIHLDDALLAVHKLLRVLNSAAERLADGLMTEAHAEDRNAAAEPAYHFLADARVLRVAGPRRKDDMRGVQSLDFANGERVIADNAHIRLDSRRLLEQVIGKRIVIVDQENHYPSTSDARSMAFITAFALFALSIYSLYGTESATMPPPACTVTVPFFLAAMRMAMQVSILPVKSR